jgi:hypothetical protein
MLRHGLRRGALEGSASRTTSASVARLRSDGGEDMVFVEFFVRASTNGLRRTRADLHLGPERNIRGEPPAREIGGHSSAVATARDV